MTSPGTATAAFMHHTCVYGSDDEFPAMAVPFTDDGLQRGEPDVAGVRRGHLRPVGSGGAHHRSLPRHAAPGPGAGARRGLWLARQLCETVEIRSGDAGTTVRLQVPSPRAEELLQPASDY